MPSGALSIGSGGRFVTLCEARQIRLYELIRAVGDLVAWTVQDAEYDLRRIVTLLVTGLRQVQPEWPPGRASSAPTP